MKTTIVVPDATRPLDYETALRHALQSVRGEVTVMVGLGLHRPMTDDELAPLRRACGGVPVVQHDATLSHSYPPEITRCDELLCIGVVEPHQYAGFSGGPKGIAIGCASADQIAAMHSLPMLAACEARVGWFEGNPFQAELWRRLEGLPPIRGQFFVPGHDGWFDGPLADAFESAVAASRRLHFDPIKRPVGSVLLRVPEPKSMNFYQASRAASYVALVDRPILRRGGTIWVEAACPEGIGLGTGELACARAMAKGRDALLSELRSARPPRTVGGEQRAYVLALVCERYEVVLVGAESIPELAALGIEQRDAAGRTDLVIDDVFSSVPVLVG